MTIPKKLDSFLKVCPDKQTHGFQIVPGQLTTSRQLNKSWTQISVRSKIGMTVWLNKTGRNNIFFGWLDHPIQGSTLSHRIGRGRFVLSFCTWWFRVDSFEPCPISDLPFDISKQGKKQVTFPDIWEILHLLSKHPEVKKTCGSFHVDLGHVGRGLQPQIFKRSWSTRNPPKIWGTNVSAGQCWFPPRWQIKTRSHGWFRGESDPSHKHFRFFEV